MNARALLMSALLALPALAAAADPDQQPLVDDLNQRLAALQADPNTADLAAFERFQAQQAIDALAQAKRGDAEQARYLAERRVAIAQASASAEAARRQADQLDHTRNDLLLEAARRETASARQDAERLRVQMQLQAEEIDRLRQSVDSETLARQDAEAALTRVAGNRAAQVSQAQQNAAKLAREEAELVSNAKLPASSFQARGEVFTFTGDAFAAGQATPSDAAASQLKALAEYLNIGKKGRVIIEAYDNAAGVGQRRAQALKDALAAAGVDANRIQVNGKKAAATRARSAEVIVAP